MPHLQAAAAAVQAPSSPQQNPIRVSVGGSAGIPGDAAASEVSQKVRMSELWREAYFSEVARRDWPWVNGQEGSQNSSHGYVRR